jgi:hypothetical protein
MMHEWLIGDNLEGSVPHLIEVLSQNWPEGTGENNEKLWIAGWDYDYILKMFFFYFSVWNFIELVHRRRV